MSTLAAVVGGLEAALASGVVEGEREDAARLAVVGARELALTEGGVDAMTVSGSGLVTAVTCRTPLTT